MEPTQPYMKDKREKVLRINDVFWTVQGEGFYAGSRALFIRMPYCNYNCTWCDTSYNSYEEWEEFDVMCFIDKEPARFAVITGGEPMMNKDTPHIVQLLKYRGFTIACETNGSFPAVDGIDFITCSPKKYSKGLPEFYINPAIRYKVHEYKYVVEKDFDFRILDRHKDDTCRLSLSPEFNIFDESIARIVNYIKENPKWKISLQTHKWMKVP